MRTAVIGAAGNVGSRVVAEALRRGHDVSAITRAHVDASDTGAVAELVAGHRRWVPAEFAALARAGADQLDVCRSDTRADWTYVTPSAFLQPGERAGRYRVGKDELLVDEAGQSYISMEDMAVAVVDEIDRPAHRRQRFTVAAAD